MYLVSGDEIKINLSDDTNRDKQKRAKQTRYRKAKPSTNRRSYGPVGGSSAAGFECFVQPPAAKVGPLMEKCGVPDPNPSYGFAGRMGRVWHHGLGRDERWAEANFGKQLAKPYL